jgi:predicted ATPase
LPQIGTHTPVLSNDGSDLAAALQTILEVGDDAALDAAIADAFPGSTVSVENIQGRFEVTMSQHGLLRPLKAAELSDGTIRYLLWVAALLTPRPPELLVLNEPETSLHPDLLPALGRLIASAADRSQVFVVTHAAKLLKSLEKCEDCNLIRLEKQFGETKMVGTDELDVPLWRWAAR